MLMLEARLSSDTPFPSQPPPPSILGAYPRYHSPSHRCTVVQMVLIGITGKKRHGKDTIAQYLAVRYGFTQFSFAGPLKEACRSLFGFDDRQLYGDGKEEEDPYWKITPRRALQFVGTDVIREHTGALIPDIGSDFWLRRFRREYDARKAECDGPFNAVVSDVRFQNEVDYIVAMGGIVIKVHRPGVGDNDAHASERGIDELTGCAHLIMNDGTIDGLLERVSRFLTSIGHVPAAPAREAPRDGAVTCGEPPYGDARPDDGSHYTLRLRHVL